MASQDLISVLLPCYNAMPYLPAAVTSILGQTYANFELVIIDDGSTDGSRDYLASLADARAHIIRTPNNGLVSALNIGLAHANGRFVARMDADDISEPQRLERQLAHMASEPHCDIVFTHATIIDHAGHARGTVRTEFASPSALEDYLFMRRAAPPIVHPSVVMRRHVIEELGGYREFTCAEDRDFWLRASRQFGFCGLAEPLIRYRLSRGGISRTRRRTQLTNSVLAVINELVFRETSIDLFEKDGPAWEGLRRSIHDASHSPEVEASLHLSEARTAWRQTDWVTAALHLIQIALKYAPHANPRNTERYVRELIIGTVSRATSTLSTT